jgi:hypothetical protein
MADMKQRRREVETSSAFDDLNRNPQSPKKTFDDLNRNSQSPKKPFDDLNGNP